VNCIEYLLLAGQQSCSFTQVLHQWLCRYQHHYFL